MSTFNYGGMISTSLMLDSLTNSLTGAALVAIGGTMGFLKTGSVTSLATAIVFAVLVAFSAFRLKKDQKAPTLLRSNY